MKILIHLLLLTIVCTNKTYGQITISHSDYAMSMQVGNSFDNYWVPNGTYSIFIGESSGSPQYWDFSGYAYEYAGTTLSIEPSSAPLISSFPNSNLVLKGTVPDDPDPIISYTFHALTSDRLFILGLTDETSISWTYDPPTVQVEFPVTFGSSWIASEDSTEIIPGVYTKSLSIVSVDAYGTLKLPTGEYPVLRYRSDNMSISVTPIGTDTSFTRSFHFYAANLVELHVPIIFDSQFGLSTIDVNGFNYAIPSGSSDLRNISNGNTPESFNLFQNYPNPFNPITEIQFQLAASGFVNLKIYDALGNLVQILVNKELGVGTYLYNFDASNLSSGIYYYQIRIGDVLSDSKQGFTQTKKMILAK